jgi:translation initiation factor IF-2
MRLSLCWGVQVKQEVFEVPPSGMTCAALADLLATTGAEVVKTLFMKGIAVKVNQNLDVETVRLVAAAFGAEAVEEDETAVHTLPRQCRTLLYAV